LVIFQEKKKEKKRFRLCEIIKVKFSILKLSFSVIYNSLSSPSS
jgi:hypothetical protein